MSFMRALAICASSSRATTCPVLSWPNAAWIKAFSAARFSLRFALASKRGSVASVASCITTSQNTFHSRSF